MSSLFTTEQKNLPGFFKTISTDDVQDCCDSKVYHRGREYYNCESVAEASYNIDKTRLEAIVKGSSDYTVTISLKQGEVSGSCTCPYGGICKHVIASLLYAIEKSSKIEIIPDSENSSTVINQYLQSLPNEELISLVKKFAPDQFWVEVKNKFSDSSSAQNMFKKVERNIQKIFKDSDCMHDPGAFDAALDKEIVNLSGLEAHLRKEIEDLLLFIIIEVDNSIDEGYLYDDYHDEHYEPSEKFKEFVTDYVKCLDYEEKTVFLTKLDKVLEEQSYVTYRSLKQLSEMVFTEDDLPALKEMLITSYKKISVSLIENYYKRVRQLLTADEREIILTEIQNNGAAWMLELANLYDSQNLVDKAINIIEHWLADSNRLGMESVYICYLDLLAKAGLSLSAAAREALSHCPSRSMLQKIVSMESTGLKNYEEILERKDAGQLLQYLEANNRLPEGLALLKSNKSIWSGQVFDFFKKHKKNFPSDAEKYFSEEINKNLEYTGDNYYHKIADIIQQLKQINQSLADEYLRDIRLTHKRRRNLVAILSKL